MHEFFSEACLLKFDRRKVPPRGRLPVRAISIPGCASGRRIFARRDSIRASAELRKKSSLQLSRFPSCVLHGSRFFPCRFLWTE